MLEILQDKDSLEIDKKFKNEAEFTTRLGKQIKEQGGFRHKISDMSMERKPFDAIASFLGKTYCIEIKYDKKNKNKLDLNSILQPYQKQSLKKIQDNGGCVLIILYSSLHNMIYIKRNINDTIVLLKK